MLSFSLMIMKKLQKALVFIVLSLTLAACEGQILTDGAGINTPACTTAAQCELKVCMKTACENGQCVWDPIPECQSCEDCEEVCGNGVIEGDETCDGNCPTTCQSSDTCTAEVLVGSANTCDARCEAEPSITACSDDDGCCPSACNSTTDSDCGEMCGNGIIEAEETCDGDCPTTCESADACVTMSLSGAAATCDAECTVSNTITACVDNDGCCPSACNNTNDNDCQVDCTDIAAWPSNWAAMEDEVIVLVNEVRAQTQTCGQYGSFDPAGPVSMNDEMRIASRCHSVDMGERNRLGHDGSDGSSFSQRLGTAGYNGQPRGENVAAGYGSAQSVVNGWMNSPGHCRNIMNSGINRMGIGCYLAPGSQYGDWWTMTTGIGGN